MLTIFPCARLPKNETNKQRTVACGERRSFTAIELKPESSHPTKRKCLTVYPDCKDSAGKSRIPLGVACFAASIPTTKTLVKQRAAPVCNRMSLKLVGLTTQRFPVAHLSTTNRKNSAKPEVDSVRVHSE